MNKYLSIITNFGCHYTCKYCIVKENGLKIAKSTIEGLTELPTVLKDNKCDIISLSGGGDPLFNYEQNKHWYEKLYTLTDLPLEMHTSYTTLPKNFAIDRYIRIVYHLRNMDELRKIKRRKNETVRAVFVVTPDMTETNINDIATFVENSSDIDELSFRQMVDNHYETTYYHYDYLKNGHGKRWWYIEQNDYNLYYVENKVYTEYKTISQE